MNGNRLATVCSDTNIAIIDNPFYKGRLLEYPSRTGWASQLDLVLLSPTLINHVTNFKIDIEVNGSDKAPVTVTLDMKDVCPFTSNALDEMAKSLGVSIYEHDNITPQKSLNHHRICMVSFSNLMNVTNPPVVNYEDINSINEVVKESEGFIMHTANVEKLKDKVINNDLPILDNMFQASELENMIKRLEPNKGYIGISPGLMKCLPVAWLA